MLCNSGLRWSAYSYCALQLRVALVCVFLFCFASQGCPGLRILIVFCNSGLRWSAYSYCVLKFRVALVCVFLLCFATQACAGLRILFAFCYSGLRWSASSYYPPWFKGGGVGQAFCNYNLALSNQKSYRLIGPTQPNFTTNCNPFGLPTYIHTKQPTTTNCLLFLLSKRN